MAGPGSNLDSPIVQEDVLRTGPSKWYPPRVEELDAQLGEDMFNRDLADGRPRKHHSNDTPSKSKFHFISMRCREYDWAQVFR